MRTVVKIIKLLQSGTGVTILIAALTLQANCFHDQGSPSCRGISQVPNTAHRASAAHIALPSKAGDGVADVTRTQSEDKVSSSKLHSVRLWWTASIPASNSLADAIEGYNIYRRGPGTEYEKINIDLFSGTSCIDDLVEAGRIYYYETRAVSENGAVSKPSLEVKVVISPR